MQLSTFLRKLSSVILLFAFLFIFTGCTSGFKTIVTTPPANYEKLGKATGSATGSLVSPLGGTAYYFIPIMLNDRIERAYSNAIASVPGATGLIDVTYKEDWYWWILGTARTVTITGEAIKEVK
jgi:hypothetical protein